MSKRRYVVIGDSVLVGAEVEVVKSLSVGGKSCKLIVDFGAYKKGEFVILDNWELEVTK